MADSGQLPVPGRLAEITPAWLTLVLRAAGLLPRGRVSRVSAAVIGADRGFTGVVARLIVSYQDAGQRPPPSLIAKLPTAAQDTPSAYRARQQHDPDAARRHYERCAREVACYRELGIAGSPAPRLYHAGTDRERLRVAMLLEDLSGGTPGDALAGGTPPWAGAVLDAIAPLHTRMWQRPAPDWVPRFVADPAAAQRHYATRVAPFLERYGDQLPAGVGDLVRRLRETYAAVLSELDQAPHTVIHDELHLDNLIFFDGSAAARPVALLDWQSVRGGPAAVDVAQVLTGSLPPAVRADVEDELLQRYSAELLAGGVADYPVTRLRHDYRLALQRRLAGIVGWLATANPDQLAGRERALVGAALADGRLVAALHDHQLA